MILFLSSKQGVTMSRKFALMCRTEETPAAKTPFIAIVDDDKLVRESLRRLMSSVSLRSEVFASAEDFLHSSHVRDTTCLILDVRMPRMDGPELQKQLAETQSRIPIIFITAYGDEKMQAQALQAGAVAVLSKPFSDETLLKSIDEALKLFRSNRTETDQERRVTNFVRY